MVCPWFFFFSLRVCMFTWPIRMMTGKRGACCSGHSNVKHWRIKGAAPGIVFNISLLQLTCRQYLHWNLGAVDCRSVKMSLFLLRRLQRHSKAPCLRLAVLPGGSVHVAVTVTCFLEKWCIACISACISKRDQRTEEVGFCFSAFPCQHSGASGPPAEALGWAS